jgi:hypothetical protein
MNKRTVCGGVLALALAVAAAGCWAQSSVEDFIQADLDARQATIAGMEQRLAVMGANPIDPQLEAALIAQSEQSVAAVFARYATTGGAHAAFAQRHAERITEWLDAHPDTVTRYEELQARWRSLADALDSARRPH